MATTDKRIDQYIDKAPAFAQPILHYLRSIVRETCPGASETIKWGFPHFEYNNSILCSMAAFKKHCIFAFWLGSKLKDPHGLLNRVGEKSAMGHFGQVKTVDDLPARRILIQYLKEAMKLNEAGVTITRTAVANRTLEVPDFFLASLKKNKKAKMVFDGFSYTNKKDYVEWLTEAKTEATRLKRLETALEWLAEGKTRNWKYEKQR